MIRKASAVWKGGLKDGKGNLSTESGVLVNTAYSFSMRFENEKGTNPEELVGAAHAGCFSMALAGGIEKAGYKATSIETSAAVKLEMLEGGPTVTEIHLGLVAVVPGLSADKFQEIAEATKQGCPISRLLNTKVVLDAKLG